ncbi:MAG: HAMP domain-containing sensor histidine kinase [Acidobacteriota bacterium]
MNLDAAYPQLVSLAAHELRTPASVITGYLRMLERDAESPLNERQRKLVTEATKSCARLVEIIAEMSDVSKMDTGLIRMVPAPLDVFALVGEVVTAMARTDGPAAHLGLGGRNEGAATAGDGARLRVAFGTVFTAIAREKPDTRGLVVDRRIVVEDGRNTAVVAIADRAQIDEAFAAPAAPFDEHRGGLGLSLPIARRIIEAHGGRLWSPSSGRGAALVALPLAG